MELVPVLYFRHAFLSSYLEGLVERRTEWAIAFRQGAALRGNHTNNYAEATMNIIKDIVLNRQVSAYCNETFEGKLLCGGYLDVDVRQRLSTVFYPPML